MVAPRTWKLSIAYDGTDFAGWQVQPGKLTIQGCLEDALGKLDDGRVAVAGSGRTDAGVHAFGQVASCSVRHPIPGDGLLKALNRMLPPSIRVTAIAEVPPGFHARHSACAKTYEYRLHRAAICPPFEARYTYWHPYPLDEEAMCQAAGHLAGERDFRSFASESGNTPESTVRTVFSSTLERRGDLLIYRVRGSGFLYRMVRNFVGMLLEVGRGTCEPAEVQRVLAARDRRAAGPTAPACGLFLASVEYPASSLAFDPTAVSSS